VVVFDGYKVKGGQGSRSDYHNIHVVYTKQDETGDMFIEKFVTEIGKNYSVRVASSDGLIQLTALRAGVLRISAQELWREIEFVGKQIDQMVYALNRKGNLVDGPKE
jgi:predicted RNA-binding protein with PIN domain